jgi:Zn-dependent protease
VEAVVGIGGPALGTVGAIAMALLHVGLGLEPGSPSYELVRQLAWFGAINNLFNLLPFPPLDGGRISAALSPWLWIAGVAGLGVLIYTGYIPLYLAVLIAVSGFPRIVNTLRQRQARDNPYYNIPRVQSVIMGICYVSLAALLTGLFFLIGKSDMLG